MKQAYTNGCEKEDKLTFTSRLQKEHNTQQLLPDSVFTYAVENTDYTDKRRNQLPPCIQQTIAPRTKKMPRANMRNKRPTISISIYIYIYIYQ